MNQRQYDCNKFNSALMSVLHARNCFFRFCRGSNPAIQLLSCMFFLFTPLCERISRILTLLCCLSDAKPYPINTAALSIAPVHSSRTTSTLTSIDTKGQHTNDNLTPFHLQ